MQQLIADHRNFSLFIDILEQQGERLESGERTDLEIVEAILGYLQRYGDQCHHPREDLVYAQLRDSDPSSAARAEAIVAEHATIQRATRDNLASVRAACDGTSFDAYALARGLHRFVADYRAHFEAENQTLFPLAMGSLGPEGWARIEAEASLLANAERALQIQDRFLALRDYIHRLDRLDRRS